MGRYTVKRVLVSKTPRRRAAKGKARGKRNPYQYRRGSAGGTRVQVGGAGAKTDAQAMAKAQAYADKYNTAITVVNAGAGFSGSYERTVGKATGAGQVGRTYEAWRNPRGLWPTWGAVDSAITHRAAAMSRSRKHYTRGDSDHAADRLISQLYGRNAMVDSETVARVRTLLWNTYDGPTGDRGYHRTAVAKRGRRKLLAMGMRPKYGNPRTGGGPAGFKVDTTGTQYKRTYATMSGAKSALNRLEAQGWRGNVNTIGGKYVVFLRIDSFLDEMSNPRRARRRNAASRYGAGSPIYNSKGWVLGMCAECGNLDYVEPHGTTARCSKQGKETEHKNIPYEYRDMSGTRLVRKPPAKANPRRARSRNGIGSRLRASGSRKRKTERRTGAALAKYAVERRTGAALAKYARGKNPGTRKRQKWIVPFNRGKMNYEDVGLLPYAIQHDVGFSGRKLYRVVKVTPSGFAWWGSSREKRADAIGDAKAALGGASQSEVRDRGADGFRSGPYRNPRNGSARGRGQYSLQVGRGGKQYSLTIQANSRAEAKRAAAGWKPKS